MESMELSGSMGFRPLTSCQFCGGGEFVFPEHVTFFEAKTLARAVTAAGFEEVSVGGYREFFPMQMLHPTLGDRPLWVPTTSLLVTGRKEP